MFHVKHTKPIPFLVSRETIRFITPVARVSRETIYFIASAPDVPRETASESKFSTSFNTFDRKTSPKSVFSRVIMVYKSIFSAKTTVFTYYLMRKTLLT